MRIQSKLFLSFLLVCGLCVGAMLLLMQWSFKRGLLDYVNQRELQQQTALANLLAEAYARQGDWAFLRDNHALWWQLNRQASPDTSSEPGPRPERMAPPPRPGDRPGGRPAGRSEFPGPGFPPPRGAPPPQPGGGPSGLILLDQDKQSIFGPYRPGQRSPLLPIRVNGKDVGWLTLSERHQLQEDFDLQFVSEQSTAFLSIAGVMILLSAGMALPLARRLVRPIRLLAAASHALAGGRYQVRVEHESQDELGLLTRDFNQLAQTLEANENARKRWIADISHELRTPLAVTRGELEAMLDGVRALDRNNIASAHQEVLHLQRLVDDLHDLTNADIGALTYRKEQLDLSELVAEEAERFAPQLAAARLRLTLQLGDAPVELWADATRMTQLIHNLLGNSVKYTDPGGEIRIHLAQAYGQVCLSIEDSAPGVPVEQQGKLCDHLYRVETSRNRALGGSGLGLAICQRIVEGHGGQLQIGSSELGGLRVVLTLPPVTAAAVPDV